MATAIVTNITESEKVEKYNISAADTAAKNMQSDAPACSVFGHITIRSGTCYKRLNCGNSLECS